MANEGNPYKGILYAGLMLTKDGPALLEYVRIPNSTRQHHYRRRRRRRCRRFKPTNPMHPPSLSWPSALQRYNCRFGDPETQVLLPLLDSDLFTIMTK